MICRQVQTEEELQQAFAIRKEVFVEEQNVPVEEEIDEFDVSPAACRHFVAYEEGKPVGAARWREYEPGTAKLQRIAVVRTSRGQGIGKLLVRAMERDAAALGYSRSLLDAQVTAEPFYRKLGYRTVSEETFLDAGIPHVRMVRELP